MLSGMSNSHNTPNASRNSDARRSSRRRSKRVHTCPKYKAWLRFHTQVWRILLLLMPAAFTQPSDNLLAEPCTSLWLDGPPAEYHVLRAPPPWPWPRSPLAAISRIYADGRRRRRGARNTSFGPTQTSQLCLHGAETELEKILHGFRPLEIS